MVSPCLFHHCYGSMCYSIVVAPCLFHHRNCSMCYSIVVAPCLFHHRYCSMCLQHRGCPLSIPSLLLFYVLTASWLPPVYSIIATVICGYRTWFPPVYSIIATVLCAYNIMVAPCLFHHRYCSMCLQHHGCPLSITSSLLFYLLSASWFPPVYSIIATVLCAYNIMVAPCLFHHCYCSMCLQHHGCPPVCSIIATVLCACSIMVSPCLFHHLCMSDPLANLSFIIWPPYTIFISC